MIGKFAIQFVRGPEFLSAALAEGPSADTVFTTRVAQASRARQYYSNSDKKCIILELLEYRPLTGFRLDIDARDGIFLLLSWLLFGL